MYSKLVNVSYIMFFLYRNPVISILDPWVLSHLQRNHSRIQTDFIDRSFCSLLAADHFAADGAVAFERQGLAMDWRVSSKSRFCRSMESICGCIANLFSVPFVDGYNYVSIFLFGLLLGDMIIYTWYIQYIYIFLVCMTWLYISMIVTVRLKLLQIVWGMVLYFAWHSLKAG